MAAGRQLFSERGYHATGTPEVAALAGVTRGALYHHFQDKEALFEAVFRELEQELQDAAAATVFDLDRWRQLKDGLQSFLYIISDRPDLQRVLILDGPVVFGWAKWRDLKKEFTLGLVTMALDELMREGVIRAQPLVPLGHLILAALNEAALLIAYAEDPKAARLDVVAALAAMVDGLR
jgi:AcrR family transcriptional regulator